MPDRRQVMAGGLLGCALGALPAQAAQMIHIDDAAILIGNGFADGVLFLDGCGQAVRAGQWNLKRWRVRRVPSLRWHKSTRVCAMHFTPETIKQRGGK